MSLVIDADQPVICLNLDGCECQRCSNARESLEAFQRTRNAPGTLYSVAGKDAGNLNWDKQSAPAATPR